MDAKYLDILTLSMEHSGAAKGEILDASLGTAPLSWPSGGLPLALHFDK
jgi:hypothetical protein